MGCWFVSREETGCEEERERGDESGLEEEEEREREGEREKEWAPGPRPT